jgi:predicted O-methyltransferase YrrM
VLARRGLRLAIRDPRRALRSGKIRLTNLRTKGRVNPDTTTFARDARPGPTARTFNSMRGIPGWFTYDDAAHFTIILGLQAAAGVTGDILEIGPFHGRSTILLAHQLQPGETLTVCDPFQIGEVYVAYPPTPAGLRRNIAKALPTFDQAQLEIIEAYSTDLDLPATRTFRFIHVDGSHERNDVLHDLRTVRRHLAPGGIIVADDYEHPDWPGVTEAIEVFRSEAPELVEVADLNRHAESGRKLYLMLPA